MVANWNGAPWIAACLSSLQLSAQATRVPSELIVVDDASSDDSPAIVTERFPRARLIRNATNKGFGATVMRGVRAARGKVVVLCNNDLAAQERFIPNLVRWFLDPDATGTERVLPRGKRLFGVSARTLSWFDGKPNQVCMNATFKGGRLNPAYRTPESAARCLFVQAGAAAYDRRLFLKLGGLLPLYAPGYWEDYDLSYRAAKSGFANLYDPEAIALHHGGGSMNRRFGDDGVARYKARNHLLFEWINLSDADLLARHCARLPVSIAQEWFLGEKPRLTRALYDALPLLPRVARERMRSQRVMRDATILRESGGGTSSY